ncbi:hypothetical protein HDG33_004888 [Paraburkholderia sp. Cpub6]|nr:hypothetical protein [Paraburkholderia sp. Cpub6]
MKMVFRVVLLVVFTLSFFIFVVPVGACSRLVSDKLRLRKHERASTYFHLFPTARTNGARLHQGSVRQFTSRNS